ncbi:MAG: hypothetical protein M1426_04860 [Patescibacteria group bacterium]|nr:hypothetical protein [Patescibacteria group bacterium]
METIEDVRTALDNIKRNQRDTEVTIISSRHHLYPRTQLIVKILGYKEINLKSAESIFQKEFKEKVDTANIPRRIFSPLNSVITWVRDIAISSILLTDFAPGNLHIGSKIIVKQVKRKRLTERR